MRDLLSNTGVMIAIPPGAYDADNIPAAIDLRGFDSAVFVLAIGAGGITFSGSNKIEFKLSHADAEDGEYTPVTATDVQGVEVASGGIVKALTSAHAAASVTKIGYAGGKPFAKLLADFSGTHGSPTSIAATVILGHPRNAPVA